MLALVDDAAAALEKASGALEPELLDGRDAAALVETAARCERLSAAIKASAARRLEETKVWRDDGHRSAAHFVAAAAGTTVGAASRALDAARAPDEPSPPRRSSLAAAATSVSGKLRRAGE